MERPLIAPITEPQAPSGENEGEGELPGGICFQMHSWDLSLTLSARAMVPEC